MKKIILIFLLIPVLLWAQKDDAKDKIPHEFTMVKSIETTPVESQGNTGTCWSFATTSFLETELIRMGKGTYDLSEMFNVVNTYPVKANIYRRYHGLANFGQGGQAHDVFNVIKKFGMVPKSAFNAKLVNPEKYNHAEFERMLKSILDISLKTKSGKLTKQSEELFNDALKVYLGNYPSKFEYDGNEYTPASFRDMLGINPDDYVELTSYTHHPFYEKIDLEIPDNFSHDLYYNIPISELVEIIDYSIENGYSVCWDGDVSEKTFFRSGYAVIPVDDKKDEKVNDDGEKENTPEIEKEITQEMRQESFDDFSTTDDHLMHITGIAKNQEDSKFYYVKNSWGTDKGIDGYWYFSVPFVRLKTVAILVHKNAIPETLKNKLGIK